MDENKTNELLARLEALEKSNAAKDEKLKMLEEVADKGRVFNYQSRRADKQPLKVKLSIYDGKLIIGWKNIKDVLVKHPTTGKTIGEEQKIEITLHDKDGAETTHLFTNYVDFSEARYNERIDATVVGKKEEWDNKGNKLEFFDLEVSDGRKLPLDSRFVN